MKRFLVALSGVLIILTNDLYAEPFNYDQWQIEQNRRLENMSKAMRNSSQEYKNRSEANAIYMKQHPNALPVQTPLPDPLKIMNHELTKPLPPINTDDRNPHHNPINWDKIESTSKVCWFHKTTRRKVCEVK